MYLSLSGRRGTSITKSNALAWAITSPCSAWQHHGNYMASAGQMQGIICVMFPWRTLPTGASIPAPCSRVLRASGHKHLRHRASAKMRSGAPRGSVRGSWATRHQLDMCTYMY